MLATSRVLVVLAVERIRLGQRCLEPCPPPRLHATMPHLDILETGPYGAETLLWCIIGPK